MFPKLWLCSVWPLGDMLKSEVMNLWVLQKRQQGLVESYELGRLCEEARNLGVALEAVAPEEIDLIVSSGGRRSIRRCGAEVKLPDALLPRTGSGTDYFALAILRQLEHLGVPVIKSSGAIEAVKDKLYAHQILAQCILPIPRTMLVRFPVDPDLVASRIGFSCVVKLLVGFYGDGVVRSHYPASFRDLMELVAGLDRSQSLILQQYIGTRPGQGLQVWVIGGQVLGAMLRRSTDGSFKANISRGGDLLLDGTGYSVCEVNSAPGFAGFEAATGLNVARAGLQHCLTRSSAGGLRPDVVAAISPA